MQQQFLACVQFFDGNEVLSPTAGPNRESEPVGSGGPLKSVMVHEEPTLDQLDAWMEQRDPWDEPLNAAERFGFAVTGFSARATCERREEWKQAEDQSARPMRFARGVSAELTGHWASSLRSEKETQPSERLGIWKFD